eukprot:TRINITY_DN87467_c0_g1_i1.p1 TRINITY_DN87467_c0_g1~~TRINITY_DN87467_c0_g1_i1.p1  ORF type:complete len:887 (+),score=125.92 TRINITY_DN87467_c0_g1_i1:249-2663(+)
MPYQSTIFDAEIGRATSPDVKTELQQLLEEAKETEKQEGDAFAKRLRERGQALELMDNARESHASPDDIKTLKKRLSMLKQASDELELNTEHARQLMRSFFVEDVNSSRKKLSDCHIRSLEDARKVATGMIFSFFRASGGREQYSSLDFSSQDQDEIFFCVKMSEETCKWHAEQSDYELQLDLEAVRSQLEIDLPHDVPDSVAMNPACVPYRESLSELFKKHPSEVDPSKLSIFRKIDMIRLLYDRVTDVLQTDAMRKWNILISEFPLHSPHKVRELKESWASIGLWWRFDQPIVEIRNYFGENIALYFVFVGHLGRKLRWLVLASVALMLANIVMDIIRNDGAHMTSRHGWLMLVGADAGAPHARILLCGFTVLWCQLFSLSLRQTVARHLSLWGMEEEDISSVKPQTNQRFANQSVLMPSDVDHNVIEMNVSPLRRRRDRYKSPAGSVVFLLFAFLCVTLIFIFKAHMARVGHLEISKYSSYILTVQIAICNQIWKWLVCPVLTDTEYLKDQLAYDNSVARKTFEVQVINTFCSFYYIAFIMKLVGDSNYQTYGGFWQYLTFQMLTTFAGFFALCCVDVVSPIFDSYFDARSEFFKLKRMGRLPQDAESTAYCYIERQGKMKTYDGGERNSDYMQVLLPLGFVVLFGSALPMGSVLCFVLFGFGLRMDAWKLTNVLRRPFPDSANSDKWVWQDIIDKFMYIGEVTNIGLVCFCLPPFEYWNEQQQVLLFFGMLSLAACMKRCVGPFFPEKTEDVALAHRRQQWQRAKCRSYGMQVDHESHVTSWIPDLDLTKIQPILGAGCR